MLFDGIFQRTNTETIMSLMKYSLDLTHPWLTKYWGKEKIGPHKQSFRDNRDIFEAWLDNSGNDLLNIFATNGTHQFPYDYGLVPDINYKVVKEGARTYFLATVLALIIF